MTARVETTTPLVQANESTRAIETQSYLDRYRAPFSLRCGALLIDYIILAIIIAFCTLLARPFGISSRAGGSPLETFGMIIALVIVGLNFGLLAAWRGQTLGKWATGLRIERKDGGPLEWWRVLLRHFAGYPLSLLTLGIGFLVAAFNGQGRALHDFIAGTIVVRDVGQRRARAVSRAAAR
ncbi:MAG: RDD family protein [Pyrinomonadaceae bacterium]|nr:RDD family protein [Pyrinomonadaceae bacterium]